ncbi:uncharacterized protein LOC109859304 [Pseudomyrmex gracilis]|uniref:uncharacterized protein LOC109859304 n=1 Tax=Pseudomyrmex gracilis TaxID=219809 RepID=UPI0009955825|nr:uncharacterized protein LOC109859304 [Pseudomyrmex gracilis]
MIDATASPVLATDTPNADLPVDSTKTYEILDEKQFVEKNIVEDVERIDDAKDQLRSESVCSYQTETVDRDGEIDDKLEVHEEKILEENCMGDIQEDRNVDEQNKLMMLSLKNNSEMTLESCKIAEADGGFVNLPRTKSNSLVTFQTPLEVEEEVEEEEAEEEAEDEIEEEARNEPVIKVDYKVDSSKILDALRNTPGLSVSVTRTHTPEHNKSQIVLPRPLSKASSSSRSPDSQAECVEKLLKNNNEFVDNRGRTNSPRSLPGLSIIIPSFRYRSTSGQLTTTSPTNAKRRVESPESTVSFHKADTYPEEIKLVKYPHEDDKMREEDEDDCDSQVLEDLRQKRTDSPIYDSMDVEYYNKSTTGPGGNREDNKTSAENAKTDSLWTGRNSEAQAKCKYQHFDEQILEELRSRGTVVSPQPSGIPCSPASRRPSSTYLERLLPSPPCSVSCSEDTNELTLRSILASSGNVETQDHEKSKEGAAIRSDPGIDPRAIYPSVDRNARNPNSQRNFQERLSVHNQEVRNSGRPMSSGDIHSTFYTMADRVAPKRPMSAEWQSTGRQRNQINYYQKVVGRTKHYHADNNHDQDQVTFAASSSTEKLLDPASQLRELVETVGHLIPDPLLVPRSYLPALAAAPAIEIPKLLVSRPELRLPEALNRPELLQDPDLLVISLAHLQHVLDHGEGPVSRSHVPVQQQPRAVVVNGNKGPSGHANNNVRYGTTTVANGRPKLSCKPIGMLMPTQPIDLSNGGRSSRFNPYPPLLRVRSGLLKQEPEVSSTASSPDESHLWHPLFGSQKRQQHHQQQQQQQYQQAQQQHVSWHRTTLAS